MSLTYKTSAAFHDFVCLGADCEDTCCRDWQVKLDKSHYELLFAAAEKQPGQHAKLHDNIVLNQNSISGDHDYAFVKMRDDGFCSMLSGQGLCHIQLDYGVDTLGDVCTMYPRVISRYQNTLEMSGSLSCPEVVRRYLSAENPLKMTRFRLKDLPRSRNYPIQRILPDDTDDYYARHFASVRQLMLQLLASESCSLQGRLYLLADLAENLSPFYHQGCDAFPDEIMQRFRDDYLQPRALQRAEQFMQGYEVATPLAMVVVHSIMSIKLQQAAEENTSRLYAAAIQSFSDDTLAEQLQQCVQQCLSVSDSTVASQIEHALTRYILNCIQREWFVAMPDLLTYVQMLLVRVLLLHTLICLSLDKDNVDEPRVQNKLIYVIYNFARNIDQNTEFLKVVFHALTEQGMMHFDFSPAFIRPV